MGRKMRRRKSQKQKNKEARAKKFNPHPRYHKHQETPVWTEVYEFEQYHTCVDEDDYNWKPCRECHDCLNKRPLAIPIGMDELTFDFDKTR